ncbi:MAG: hypothetical protein Q8P67_28555, partial [archaeon]|nr:hypothetical protein [archaeon]
MVAILCHHHPVLPTNGVVTSIPNGRASNVVLEAIPRNISSTIQIVFSLSLSLSLSHSHFRYL